MFLRFRFQGFSLLTKPLSWVVWSVSFPRPVFMSSLGRFSPPAELGRLETGRRSDSKRAERMTTRAHGRCVHVLTSDLQNVEDSNVQHAG